MIRINKAGTPPSILKGSQSKGGLARQGLKNQYDANPTVYHIKYSKKHNPHKLKVDNEVYGHKTVKAALISDQHDKCCFCESKFSHTSFGDVEHFRPKGGYQRHANDKLKYPGYYWLAYDWNNLLYSCEVCNRRYKKNRFPLANDAKRATNHHDSINNESPLIIHPAEEDPEKFLTFNQEVIVPKNNSKKGKESIKVYGLHRLEDQRKKHLDNVKRTLALSNIDYNDTNAMQTASGLLDIPANKLKPIIIQARKDIAIAATDKGEYAAMIRANFPNLPRI